MESENKMREASAFQTRVLLDFCNNKNKLVKNAPSLARLHFYLHPGA